MWEASSLFQSQYYYLYSWLFLLFLSRSIMCVHFSCFKINYYYLLTNTYKPPQYLKTTKLYLNLFISLIPKLILTSSAVSTTFHRYTFFYPWLYIFHPSTQLKQHSGSLKWLLHAQFVVLPQDHIFLTLQHLIKLTSCWPDTYVIWKCFHL